MPLEMCYLLIRKRAQICDRFLNILPCSADFTRVDRPTILEVSVTRIAFKYKHRGFRINVFQK